MWNIFEHWWTALLIALIVQIVLAIIHIIKPNSRRFWHVLIPVAIIVIGIGVERLVQTDMEKINALIGKSLKVTQDEDLAGIDAILADDYSDSCNSSKEAVMVYCKRWFSRPLIAKNKLFSPPQISLSTPRCEVSLVVVTHLDPKSEYYESAKLLLIKVRLYLQKYDDGKWLIKEAELLEINNQPVKWNQI
jgi:hypothetical protein